MLNMVNNNRNILRTVRGELRNYNADTIENDSKSMQ